MNTAFIPISGHDSLGIGVQYLDLAIKNGYRPEILMVYNEDMLDDRVNYYERQAKAGDVLIIPGGRDVSGASFGYDDKQCYNTCLLRDYFEQELIMSSLNKKIPIFGICRGFQIAMLALVPHNKLVWWQDVDGHVQKSNRDNLAHYAEMVSGKYSKYKGMCGKRKKGQQHNRIPINSFHHQAFSIKDIGKDPSSLLAGTYIEFGDFKLVVDAKGTHGYNKTPFIEAATIYDRDSGDVVFAGVQWHPEELRTQKDSIVRHALEVNN